MHSVHSSRMRTVRFSGRLSYLLPCMPPCHACPTTHVPQPCMPPMHVPATHASMAIQSPCHVCPLPHMSLCHTCPPTTHAPLPCQAPQTPHPPTRAHTPSQSHTFPSEQNHRHLWTPWPCIPLLAMYAPLEQNHRRLWKHNLAATTLRTVKILEISQIVSRCAVEITKIPNLLN